MSIIFAEKLKRSQCYFRISYLFRVNYLSLQENHSFFKVFINMISLYENVFFLFGGKIIDDLHKKFHRNGIFHERSIKVIFLLSCKYGINYSLVLLELER